MRREEKVVSRKVVVKPAVAVFIDLENIRYGFLNEHKSEPEFSSLIESARDLGPLLVAFAYADFQHHPEIVRRQLETLGVTCRDVPLRKWTTVDGEKRLKSSADNQMILDIVETVLDRPQVKTFILGTGDSDFIRIVTMLRNRFGKDVTVAGVPKTTSADLRRAATSIADFEVPNGTLNPENPIVKGLIWLIKTNTPPTGFWTYKQIEVWANSAWNGVPGDQISRSNMLQRLVRAGVLTQKTIQTEQQEVRITELNEDNEIVRQVLAGEQPVLNKNTA